MYRVKQPLILRLKKLVIQRVTQLMVHLKKFYDRVKNKQ